MVSFTVPLEHLQESNMGGTLQRVTQAFYLLFCAITLAQLVFLIKDSVESTELYTEMEIVPTLEKGLPLTLSVCLSHKSAFNITELLEAGYPSPSWYNIGNRYAKPDIVQLNLICLIKSSLVWTLPN